MTAASLASAIRDRVHFAEAAYRDGEWRCMLGDKGQTCDGTRYTPELGAALRRTLLEPVGQQCAYFDRPEHVRLRADAWRAQHKPAVSWVVDRLLMQAVVHGAAGPLFAAMRTRRVVLVGPAHLQRLDPAVLVPAVHCVTHPSEAWQRADVVCENVLAISEPDDLVLFCAGMASNLMIHRLWPLLRGSVTLYDAGAALDPFCGVYSRGVYRTRKWQATTMHRNLA